MKGKWIGFVAACVVLAAWGATVQADPPPPTLWTAQIGSSRADYAHGIAVDGSGNSYITGYTWGDLGGPNQGRKDAFVVKCDSGGTVQWARQFGTIRGDLATGIAVDSSGNGYITGYTYGDLGGPRQGLEDAFIAKYDSGGTVQWTRQIGTSSQDQAHGIAVDGSGNSYITGWTSGDLGGPNQGDYDAFIAKYDSGGTVQWTRQFGTGESDFATGIAVDGSGNSYIAGGTSGGGAFIVKCDGGGTEQWRRQIGTSEYDDASGIAVDASGNSYITGRTDGHLGGPSQGESDGFIVKYDSGGTEQWRRQIGTSDQDDVHGIAVDGAGKIYIAGWTKGDLGGPNQGGTDAFIVKYDSGGSQQWTRQIGTGSSDGATGIAVDASGRSYIAGYTYGDLGGPSQGRSDAFVAAIGPAPAEVSLDIKPGSWLNPLSPVSKGLLPAAVCGTDEFDVMTIDTETLLLGREGIDGVAPLRWSYDDVAAPFEGEWSDGHGRYGDGFMDLALKFRTQELVSTLGLDLLTGQAVPLVLTGSLLDGTPLTGSDFVWVLSPGDGNMDGQVDGLDYIGWSSHYRTGAAWSEGEFNGDGVVDGLDYIIWSNNYDVGFPAAVPEPAAVALLALGVLAIIHRRRHKA